MDNSLDLYYHLLERLESLARRILEGKLRSVQDMWQFEIDLAKFQIEQQRAMNTERKHREEVNAQLKEVCRAKKEGWEVQRQHYQNKLQQNKDRVNMYSHAYDIARRLGDTLAWIFLDRMQITSRSRDPSMPSSAVHRVPEGHGVQGILAIAEMLCKAGAGFPILHDITSCLRVGDITFYAPDGDPLTVEVKTRLKGYQGDKMVLKVEVYCVSMPSEDTRWNVILTHIPQEIVVPEDISANDQVIQEPQAIEEGLQRQMERMAEVAARQTVQDGELLRLGERKVYIVQHLTSEQSMHHYDILQELTRDSKAQGFAWRTVDDAFVYTAVYKDTPLWLQEGGQIIPEQSVEDYQRANISIAFPEPAKNFACIYDVFNSPPFVRPFFMYPLPVDIVMDMMWKRLQIIVTINLGKLVAALQAIGVNARLPKNKQESDKLFLPVSLEIPLPDERKAYGELRNLQCYGAQITHEFLSLQGFVKLITYMIEITAEQGIKEGVYDNFL